MTREQAQRAAETLEDVFTPEGDAVVIDKISPRGSAARVTGARVYGAWFYLTDLTAKEDL